MGRKELLTVPPNEISSPSVRAMNALGVCCWLVFAAAAACAQTGLGWLFLDCQRVKAVYPVNFAANGYSPYIQQQLQQPYGYSATVGFDPASLGQWQTQYQPQMTSSMPTSTFTSEGQRPGPTGPSPPVLPLGPMHAGAGMAGPAAGAASPFGQQRTINDNTGQRLMTSISLISLSFRSKLWPNGLSVPGASRLQWLRDLERTMAR